MVKETTVHTFRVEKCSSTLKTGAVNSSETVVPTYQTACRDTLLWRMTVVYPFDRE